MNEQIVDYYAIALIREYEEDAFNGFMAYENERIAYEYKYCYNVENKGHLHGDEILRFKRYLFSKKEKKNPPGERIHIPISFSVYLQLTWATILQSIKKMKNYIEIGFLYKAFVGCLALQTAVMFAGNSLANKLAASMTAVVCLTIISKKRVEYKHILKGGWLSKYASYSGFALIISLLLFEWLQLVPLISKFRIFLGLVPVGFYCIFLLLMDIVLMQHPKRGIGVCFGALSTISLFLAIILKNNERTIAAFVFAQIVF